LFFLRLNFERTPTLNLPSRQTTNNDFSRQSSGRPQRQSSKAPAALDASDQVAVEAVVTAPTMAAVKSRLRAFYRSHTLT
jgi:hypothetical protein